MSYTPERALRVIAEKYGCDATVESIARQVYRDTDCCAYFDIVGRSIVVGTIVEGSDAETTVDLDLDSYEVDNAGDSCLVSDFGSAIVECEVFAETVTQRDLALDYDVCDEMYGDNGVDLLDW